MARALDFDRTLNLFSLFADLEGERLEKWRGLCATGIRRIESLLRDDVDAADDMEALCAAAAAWSYSDYLMLEHASGVSDELRVGDISVKAAASSAERDATEIREHFLAGVSHLLRPVCPALIAVGEAMP